MLVAKGQHVDAEQSLTKLRAELAQSKAEAQELDAKLKTARQDALRALRDRQDLYEEGSGAPVIKFGKYRFNVNTQQLDLTLVPRDGALYLQLSGTDYAQKLEEPELEKYRELWEQARRLRADARSPYGAVVAIEAMGRAIGELDKLSTSGALPFEMEALNQLLKAEAENKRRHVARQQQAGAGAGGVSGSGGASGASGASGAGTGGSDAGASGSAGSSGSGAGEGGSAGSAGSAGTGGAMNKHWVGSWATGPQLTEEANLPPTSLGNNTLRQIVHATLSGDQIRVHGVETEAIETELHITVRYSIRGAVDGESSLETTLPLEAPL